MIDIDTRFVTHTVEKVTAFVTRGEGESRELLVFQHPTAGIQLPAGTVELGETPEAAVRREVWEETGLRDVVVVRRLASVMDEIAPDERMVLKTPVYVRIAPSPTAPFLPLPTGGDTTVPFVRRGMTCRHLRENDMLCIENGFAKVGFDLWNIDGEMWTIQESTAGWVPIDVLTTEVNRHLFQLNATIDTLDHWMYNGDVPGCRLYWTPMAQDTGLVPTQEALLARVRELFA